ncbi:MAG: hypothetical protein KC445_09095, partial [Anaerolineales bacterium]|nr:hypothetical protein [Anaerolineales bacterium]
LRQVNVPAKQLEYALVVLPMPVDELPETYQAGNLSFQNGMLVIKPEEAETQAKIVPETAVPIVPQQSTVELVVNNNVSQIWRLEMKGYYGNRWDVWEKYVAGRGNGMSWETFKETVLVYNPHLEADGFVFYPEKTYLLPFAQ